MIEITMNSQRLKLQIKGHALETENADHHAICTAISTVAQGMVYCISKLGEAENAIRNVQYRREPGDFYALIIPEQWAENMIRHRFRNFGDALEMMAKCYPECITMIWDGEKILPDGEEMKDE